MVADPNDPAGAGDDAGTDDADTGADAGTADAGDEDTGSAVLVTIAKGPDGGYLVYAGDEPDEGDEGSDDEGQSEDDINAEAGAGGGEGDQGGAASSAPVPAPAGAGAQHADSIGQALKFALDILDEDASSEGGEGTSEDQFAAGFNEGKEPTPAAPKTRQKYPATPR